MPTDKEERKPEVFATPVGTSMNMLAAANFLGLHYTTLQERAKSGEIRGAKIGKEWRFLAEELVQYIKLKYKQEDEEECRSTNQNVRPTGGSTCKIHMEGQDLESQQKSITTETASHASKRKKSTTGAKRKSGKSSLRVVRLTMR